MNNASAAVSRRRLITAVGCLTLAALAWLLGVEASASYVITPQGHRIEGTDIRAKADGEVILQTPQGSRTFYKGQYVKAVADKPQEWDRAAQLVDAKKYDEAIKLLEDVVSRYRYLDWDQQARAILPIVYVRKGDLQGAITAYERLFALVGTPDAEAVWGYRQVLLDAKQFEKLEKSLAETIAAGSRADAARAQIMRGDIRAAQNQLELALQDYLRTVVLFKNERASQPEALLKAAQTLEKLRDNRAADMYRKIVEEYSSSPQAATARAKL